MGDSCNFQENGINPYIWCLVGGAMGWLATKMAGGGRALLIENVLVGVFGAFVGGDFIVSSLNGGVVNDTDFKIGSLGMAIAGAVVMLLILRLMRKMVGPLRNGKSRKRS